MDFFFFLFECKNIQLLNVYHIETIDRQNSIHQYVEDVTFKEGGVQVKYILSPFLEMALRWVSSSCLGTLSDIEILSKLKSDKKDETRSKNWPFIENPHFCPTRFRAAWEERGIL